MQLGKDYSYLCQASGPCQAVEGRSLRDALIRPALPESAAVADPGLVMKSVCSKRQQG